MANTYILRKNQKLDLSDATAFDPDDTWMLNIGASSSSAGSGFPLSATKTSTVGIFSDDNGASISSGTHMAGIRVRTLLTYTAGNREQEVSSVRGQLVSKSGVNRHNMCAVLGSYEVNTALTVDGQAATTDTWAQSAVQARIGAGNGITTINSNGVLAGFAAMSATQAFAANSGVYAAYYVGAWATAMDWGYGLYIQGDKVSKAIQVGELSSTAQTGFHLTSTYNSVINSYADDNNTTLGDAVYSNIHARTMLFKACTAGTITAVKGQLKFADEADMGPGVFAGVQGYMELYDDADVKSGGKFWAVDASIDVPTGGILTVDSGGIAAGLHAELTGLGTATSSGILAGLYVDAPITTGNWDYGVYIDCDSVVRGIQVGTLGSNITSGVPLLNATSINGFYSDDNGADQTTGTVMRNVTARTYFSVDQTAAAADYYVLRGHLKAASGVDFGGDTSVKAAVNGYSEFAGATVIGAGSFFASVFGEFWGDNDITGTGKAAGVMSRLYTAAGTTSGTTAAFMATKHFASTQEWPYGLYIDSATCDIRLANGSGAGIYSRATSPNGALTAPKGSICLVPNGTGANDRIWINTDSGTTWTSLTAGA